MIDHLTQRTALRSPCFALQQAVATMLDDWRLPGVTYRQTARGLCVKVGGMLHLLVLHNRPGALEQAIETLEQWNAIERARSILDAD